VAVAIPATPTEVVSTPATSASSSLFQFAIDGDAQDDDDDPWTLHQGAILPFPVFTVIQDPDGRLV
jgi:hypothetical protein